MARARAGWALALSMAPAARPAAPQATPQAHAIYRSLAALGYDPHDVALATQLSLALPRPDEAMDHWKILLAKR